MQLQSGATFILVREMFRLSELRWSRLYLISISHFHSQAQLGFPPRRWHSRSQETLLATEGQNTETGTHTALNLTHMASAAGGGPHGWRNGHQSLSQFRLQGEALVEGPCFILQCTFGLVCPPSIPPVCLVRPCRTMVYGLHKHRRHGNMPIQGEASYEGMNRKVWY